MGLINNNNAYDMKVYLTELGRLRLLEQGFVPASFSLSDEDANYNANLQLDQVAVDLTGDYNDDVYSLSKNATIKNQIIK